MRARATRLSATGGKGRGVGSVFATASAAYSLRIPAGTSYSGPLVRVRRASDNSEVDIGAASAPDARGNRWLDTAGLAAFAGGANAFVNTWYDQSGHGRNAVQATLQYQPRIVNAGAVDTINGAPTLFSQGFTWLAASAPMSSSVELTVNMVIRPSSFTSSVGNGLTPWSMGTDPVRILGHTPWSDGVVYFDCGSNIGGARVSGSLGVVPNTPFVATFQNSVSQSLQSVRVNGGLIAGDTTGHAAAVTGLMIIGRPETDQSLRGAFAELVVFSNSLDSSARLRLERSQGVAFGISVA